MVQEPSEQRKGNPESRCKPVKPSTEDLTEPNGCTDEDNVYSIEVRGSKLIVVPHEDTKEEERWW